MQTEQNNFSKRLIRLRKRNRFSQRFVAHALGIPESTYREWEYGRQISGEPYVKLAHIFGVTLEELFGVESSTLNTSLEKKIEDIIAKLSEIRTEVVKLKQV